MNEAVPKGWTHRILGDALTTLPKSKLPSGAANPNGFFDFYVCSKEIQKSDYCEHKKPSILLSTGGEAAIHFPQTNYSYSTDIWAISFKDPFCNEFIFRILENSIEYLNYSGFQGSGIKHLDKDFLKRQKILCPPISEQKKIASILSSVDELIENTQKQIDKLQDLKKANMNELLNKGIGHTEFRDSKKVSKGWTGAKLGDIAKFRRGTTYVASELSEDSYNHPLYITMKSFSVGGGYSEEGDKYYSSPYKREQTITKNELLLANTDVTQSCDILGSPLLLPPKKMQQDTLFSHHVTAVEINSQVDINFLFYLLTFPPARLLLQSCGRGTTVKMLDIKEVRKLSFYFPPLSEQRNIVSILASVDEMTKDIREQINKLQSLKKSLMQDLLTGKIRVQVD